MPSIPGMINGGALLKSPTALPGSTRALTVDTAGQAAYADYDASGAAAAAQAAAIAASQPLDSDLTAIAALSTTAFGRALLTMADAAATRTAIGAGTSNFSGAFSALSGIPTTLSGYGITDAQPLDSDLTAIAALATTSFGRALLALADAAALRAAAGLGTLATQNGTFSGTSSGTNTGDQTISLTGDVTGSGTGSLAATIANDAVTYSKLQNVSATSRILGRKTAAAGDTEECTLSDILDFIGSAAQGDILYRDASAWGRLGAATRAGFRLKSGGAAANPSWVDAQPSEDAFRGSTGCIASTFDRRCTIEANISPLVSAQLYMVGICLTEGQLITNISFWSATTALSVGSNQWFALFDSSRNKLAVTGDDTSTAWAANTKKTLALSSTYTVTASGFYYLGLMVKATTPPSLGGGSGFGTAIQRAAAPTICGNSSSTGLTNPASCPSTAGAITLLSTVAYGEVS